MSLWSHVPTVLCVILSFKKLGQEVTSALAHIFNRISLLAWRSRNIRNDIPRG